MVVAGGGGGCSFLVVPGPVQPRVGSTSDATGEVSDDTGFYQLAQKFLLSLNVVCPRLKGKRR